VSYLNSRAGLLPIARQYAFTGAVCIAIAVMIYLLKLGGDSFLQTLIISFAIGLTTQTVMMIAFTYLPPGFPLWLRVGLFIPIGAITGLTLGAWLAGIPIALIFDDYSNSALSLGITLAAFTFFYAYHSVMAMREALQQEAMDKLNSEKKLVETQLRLLQSQIEPHFLFNTLSNVISLIRLDAEKAEEMLMRLTQFLRSSLRRSRNIHGSLADEVELLYDYLAIYKIRLEDRLEFEFDINVEESAVRLPPLLLQPLVENSVIHGLEPLEEGGTITIRAKRVDDQLVLTVEDTGKGLTKSGPSHGLGIHSVRERLEILYGSNSQVTRGLGDVYKRQGYQITSPEELWWK